MTEEGLGDLRSYVVTCLCQVLFALKGPNEQALARQEMLRLIESNVNSFFFLKTILQCINCFFPFSHPTLQPCCFSLRSGCKPATLLSQPAHWATSYACLR